MKEEIKEALKLIESYGYVAYLVGGYPRDYFLNKLTTDYDICTSAPKEILLKIFSRITDNHFGSYKVEYQNISMEITTFRIESGYYATRSPMIMYTDSLEDDLKRRDFIMNTLCMDKDGNMVDLLGAKRDLREKVIRSVGNPFQKLKEDPLRILRAIRFATVLDFSIEEELSLAIARCKDSVFQLSYTRKREELDKILMSINCQKGIKLLKQFKLDKILECDFDNVVVVPSLEGMWAQIHYPPQYPFSKRERRRIETLKEAINYPTMDIGMLYYYEFDICKIVCMIKKIDMQILEDMKKELPISSRKDIQISPSELTRLGYPIKESYQALEHKILRGEISNCYSDIINYLEEYFL